jgi:hypothetical protein|tara:strand:- start:238 stop:1086 length:849 start_codon:yes stop_codon:yes gene_type:complete
MKKENKTIENTQTPLERFSNENANLKRYLGLALKNTRDIMKLLLPKIAVEVRNLIQSVKNSQIDLTKTDKLEKTINEKAIRERLYDLVNYNRKEEENGAFEIVVYRAIKLGKMLVDSPKEFDVDVKNSKIFVMSKVATPMIEQKLKGQKGGTKKVANTSDELVEVNTGTIDRVYKVKYGGGSGGGSTDKNILIDTKFKSVSSDMFKLLDRAINYSMKKNVKFFDMVDEDVWNNLSNIFTLFNSDAYKDMREFSQNYRVSISGDLENIKDKMEDVVKKSQKIA